MTRMYHAVGNEYQIGEDVYSYDELEQMDLAPAWKWEGEPFDTDVVSVTEDLAEAQGIAEQHGLSRILVIDWEIVSEQRVTGVNEEGYPIAYGHIPAEAISNIIQIDKDDNEEDDNDE